MGDYPKVSAAVAAGVALFVAPLQAYNGPALQDRAAIPGAAHPFHPIYTCAGLVKLPLPHAAITSSQLIPAGSYSPAPGSAYANLPEFCRVVGVSTPTPNSKIGFEVWLPTGTSYNGKFRQVGNGGFAGSIIYDDLADGIRRGYATASTDDGHQGFQDPTFAKNSPDRIADFGWRAVKETTDKSKAIIWAFTGTTPKFSYFTGCSDGGREALITAQRNPSDFDGIIAGAPANHWTHQFAGLGWDVQAAYDHTTFAASLPPPALAVLSAGGRAQCAGKDGGLPTDKFLTDPRLCAINWTTIQCTAGQDPATCLSAAQVAAVKAIYAGPKNPVTHKQIYPGYEPGSEDQAGMWQFWITGPLGVGPFPTFGLGTFYGEGFFANFVFNVALYNLMTFNFASDMTAADALAPDLNATNADLSAFRAHGGKLIEYVGWADPGVAPQDTINYYENVRTTLSLTYAEQQSFHRLFVVPGMGHCSGGPGATVFGNAPKVPAPVQDADHDVLKALELWRENGVAPQKITATKYVADTPASGIAFQRPICPYPQLPRYGGKPLDPNSASSYTCQARLAIRPVGRLLGP
jgi:hypothetical protein